MALTSIPRFDGTRLRSYILRLPLFTRLCILLIILFYFLCLMPALSLSEWGSLWPSKIRFTTLHRLNTYPFIHAGLLHTLFNLFALTPLMDRFESEHGTLLTAALFSGPLATIPALLYVVFELYVLRGDTPVMGASVWVFLLLSYEAINKLYRSHPSFDLAGLVQIPTWTTPLILVVLTNIFIPHTSFWGHLAGCAVGYAYGLGYLKVLAPPDRVLRWVEGKGNLLGRVPHYVSLDQKTYGRYGVLPTSNSGGAGPSGGSVQSWTGGSQRLGP
ncbi:MAG: hypothetical protein Q9227_005324 [Pyrenula ochraceoflavens]